VRLFREKNFSSAFSHKAYEKAKEIIWIEISLLLYNCMQENPKVFL